LHLLGYDHATPEDEARMWARQDDILRALGYGSTDATHA
jgi:ssRNA-specific RNase YbeY (16S rRNA maturation enzyme)